MTLKLLDLCPGEIKTLTTYFFDSINHCGAGVLSKSVECVVKNSEKLVRTVAHFFECQKSS